MNKLLDWSIDEIKNELDNFIKIYSERPIKKNDLE